MSYKYNLPRPGDVDWDAANPVSAYKCLICGGKTIHIEKYDAYACLECNVWREDRCKDNQCEFCSSRPEFPREAK